MPRLPWLPFAILICTSPAFAQDAEQPSLLDGVESALEASQDAQSNLETPDPKKQAILGKLLAKLAKPVTSAKAELGLLKKVAAAADKRLADDALLVASVDQAVAVLAERAAEALSEAADHLDKTPDAQAAAKVQAKLDKAQARLEQALGKPSAKAAVGALGKATRAAEKAQSQAHAANYDGPGKPTGLGGYYAGSTSEGAWAAGHVSGAGLATLAAQEFPLFTVMLEKGSFSTTIGGCKIKGKVTGKGITGKAVCDGALKFKLTRVSDSGPGSMFAGVFEQSDASGAIEAVITPAGDVFFNSFVFADEDENDSGQGSIAASGDFALVSVFDGSITGTAAAGSGELSGTYTVEGENPVAFSLGATTGLPPVPLSIDATKNLDGKIKVAVEVPSLQEPPSLLPPHTLTSIRTYVSFTPEFADATPFDSSVQVIGGHAAGTYTSSLPGQTMSFAITHRDWMKAPTLYFWATVITQDGESLPVGPVAGWAADRDIVPTIYYPGPGVLGLPDVIAPGTAVGKGRLRARANLPGEFGYSPEEGTVLPEGEHTVEVTFIPGVVGYPVVMDSFDVVVGGG